MKRLVFITLFLFLAACAPPIDVVSYQPLTLTSAQMALVEATVTRDLFDPESARFRDVYAARSTVSRDGEQVEVTVVCGYINAKNRVGGYVGFTPFATALLDGQVGPVEIDDNVVRDCERFGFVAS